MELPESTRDVKVPEGIIEQVIGQERGVEVMKKAALQRRHVMLIGKPGTGKSMLAQGMAELLSREELEEVIVFPNSEDDNEPLVKTVKAGQGKLIVSSYKNEVNKTESLRNLIALMLIFCLIWYGFFTGQLLTGIIAAALLFVPFQYLRSKTKSKVPKLLITHRRGEKAPFLDATGAHEGSLLGDVRHDPFQSGGLETPAHDRVEPGSIHRAHKGVLFIDEIATLKPEMQIDLLSAMQEKKYSITGRSERSSGAMVRTKPVPCDFVLVAAGNVKTIEAMNPALRSRIRGYGYEVYMNDTIPDTEANQQKVARFVAQEVTKDAKIPHFSKAAIEMVIYEARRRANRKGHLTLRLRELGGLVRAAGDIAKSEDADLVDPSHITKAKVFARTLEQQIADKYIEEKKEYKVFRSTGTHVGKVNGLAVFGDSGIVLPIVANVTPSMARESSRIIATGKLGEIAKEAIKNVSAPIKKYFGKDIANFDVHIQFLQTYEGVEGDSASISVVTAVVSALEQVAIRQSVAMTGSLSVRGDVLPVGGVTSKIEAAIEAGIQKVLIPAANLKDVLLDDDKKGLIEVIPVDTISDVLEHALVWKEKKDVLNKIKRLARHTTDVVSGPVPTA
ncbi:MAG: ATP-dependent protease LonB [Candidatus Undinarchaeales archaeon]|nr:ATP-dependent protease LonB [Candidatus Undinarchaeales archaeon]